MPETQRPNDPTTQRPAHRAIDPKALSVADAHRLLLHCVAPRPIAFASTLSPEGVANLAPFSYFMAGGANPPSIVISPLTARDGGKKDTLINIEASGEYVINAVTFAMANQMNYASAEFPYGVDEFQQAGFTPAPCVLVKPARVLESPLSLECRLFQVVRHGDGPLSGNYIIGEVVYFHVLESILDENGALDALQVDYISRMGADWYCRSNADNMFEMPRPPRVEKNPPVG